MTPIQKQLFNLKDSKYKEFTAKLTPTISSEKFIGVRVPELRQLSKQLSQNDIDKFLTSLPHEYYDENLLHSILLCSVKPFEKSLNYVENFLPFVDNWAVCDTLIPKIFGKEKTKLLEKINEWILSKNTFKIRFGIKMLMTHFLDSDFKKEYLHLAANIKSDEYYVNMMIAWFFATALAKQWDDTIELIKQKKLSAWVHNKTIQKACESFRITSEQKVLLKTLKR